MATVRLDAIRRSSIGIQPSGDDEWVRSSYRKLEGRRSRIGGGLVAKRTLNLGNSLLGQSLRVTAGTRPRLVVDGLPKSMPHVPTKLVSLRGVTCHGPHD